MDARIPRRGGAACTDLQRGPHQIRRLDQESVQKSVQVDAKTTANANTNNKLMLKASTINGNTENHPRPPRNREMRNENHTTGYNLMPSPSPHFNARLAAVEKL